MKRAERDAWVAALRSGKYEQGRDFLRNGNNYCSLGVLCDVDGADWKRYEPDREYYSASGVTSEDSYDLRRHSEIAMPNPERVHRLGLSYETRAAVIDMNDSGRSFSEIADYIEANEPVTD